ncbi:peptidyl-prolyl cis-trans isomerase [Paenibacillus agaridevorans]|uniref:peptidylprolyl isomerase n=1 Tax=Paenibacillus agaridevorans TaxID=171404 RepID=A0A2R5EZF6_9BACL|nr:peptidylprolyl isomerase [Paenibacillus agaridevorans]GBG09203.1 peptidyl-prolyl cis-trans isomerase [Paenibacillus agaridevorans]
MTKRWILPVIVVLGAVSIWGILSFNKPPELNNSEDQQTVATVNGEPISVDEFMLLLNNNYVARTFNYFANTHGVNDFKHFWTSTYGGEKPIEYAKQLTLKEFIRIKSEQSLMKQYGVASDISYKSLLNDREAENKRRQQAVDNNQVIYGPQTYSEYQYFTHVFTNNVLALKKSLGQTKFAIDDNMLKDAYERLKEEYFIESYQIKVEKMSITKSQNAVAVMRGVQEELQNGESMGNLQDTRTDLIVETQTFDGLTAKTDYELNPQLLEEAQKLEVGEISGIIDENNALTLIRCVENKERGYQPFQLVKEQVKFILLDKKYEELVQREMEHADVKINESVFNQLSVEQ